MPSSSVRRARAVGRLLTPTRRRGVEYLDEPGVPAAVVRRSLRDVVLANRLFGGARAVLVELRPAIGRARDDGGALSLLDVGTGLGDIPARARAMAAASGVRLRTFGVDGSEPLAREARGEALPVVRADALRLPLRDRAVDIAMCSQLLHHFERPAALELLRELDRVARRRVIVSDIRRSWLAAGGIWLASWVLRFHPVSRHDGVVSVMRGFTGEELREMVRAAVGRSPAVRRRAGFRVSASWSPLEGS
jgi:2-polyprenyl-3-methyl-5-hydroxy-6-metoxy-1,4-benzoquinol methylase